MAENLLLWLLAVGVSVLLSFGGVQTLLGLNQNNLPRADESSVNWRALVFTFAVSSLVAIVLGFVPLLRLGGRDLQARLKEAGRGQTANAPVLGCARCWSSRKSL